MKDNNPVLALAKKVVKDNPTLAIESSVQKLLEPIRDIENDGWDGEEEFLNRTRADIIESFVYWMMQDDFQGMDLTIKVDNDLKTVHVKFE